jgi:hypothetical protein
MGTGKEFFAQPGVSVFIENGPNEITTYAHVVGLLFGTDEVLFHFALRTETDLTKAIGVARVYLSLPHAKRMLQALSAGIENLEKLFGEIVADPAQRLTPEQLQELQNKKLGV